MKIIDAEHPEDVISKVKSIRKIHHVYDYHGAHVGRMAEKDQKKYKSFSRDAAAEVLAETMGALKKKNNKKLIGIHDNLMVSDIELAYNVLLIMLKLNKKTGVYTAFVSASKKSKVHEKGLFRRCLLAIPLYNHDGYNAWHNYFNPVLDKFEFYTDFALDVILKSEGNQTVALKTYQEQVFNKYKDLIRDIKSNA